MKPFHFTLEAVRTLRQRQEQKAQELYAQALLARQQAMDNLAAAQRELDAASQALIELSKGAPAIKFAQANDYKQHAARRRDECALALGAAERRVNAAMQGMRTARQQREIVDKFFEKQKLRHQRELTREEQKLLDDLAGRRSGSLFAWNPNTHSS